MNRGKLNMKGGHYSTANPLKLFKFSSTLIAEIVLILGMVSTYVRNMNNFFRNKILAKK